MEQTTNEALAPTATTTIAAPESQPRVAGLTSLPAAAPWWALWLEANWQTIHHWIDVTVLSLIALIAELWPYIGDQVMAFISPTWRPQIAAAVALILLVMRLKSTKPPKELQ